VEEEEEDGDVDVLTVERVKLFSSDDEDDQILGHLPIEAIHVLRSAGPSPENQEQGGAEEAGDVSRKIKFPPPDSDGTPYKHPKTGA